MTTINAIAHFAIHADDPERAKTFYEQVFGWEFRPWGPPEFWMIETPGIHGSLQRRHDPVAGQGMIGFECTVAVDDLEAITTRVTESGGTITMPRCVIPTVGALIKLTDTEGNVLCAMQYD